MMQLSDGASRPGSTPMSLSRTIELEALCACSVLRTRWPVVAACIAIRAVSSSRISPTRMTSGSLRRIVRSPRAKVRPADGSISIWPTPGIWYSTGSSIVTRTLSGWLSRSSAA